MTPPTFQPGDRVLVEAVADPMRLARYATATVFQIDAPLVVVKFDHWPATVSTWPRRLQRLPLTLGEE